MPPKPIASVIVIAAVLLLVAAPPAARAQTPGTQLTQRIEVGQFHLRSGRWQEAAAVFAPLAESPDANAGVFRGLGEAYLNMGRRDDAIRALEEAQRRSPDGDARLLLVNLYGENREGWPRAIELLQQHAAAVPSDVEHQRRLAELLVYENRVDEAVPVLSAVVAARPEDAQALLLYGRTLAWTGEFASAAPVFDRALAAGGALQPDDGKLVAQAQEAVGNSQRANDLYRIFLQTKPNNTTALAGQARTALALQRPDEARGAIDRLRTAAQQDPELELTVARLDAEAGRREQALPVFERALAGNPSPALAQEYADMLAAVGRNEEAVEIISRFPDTSATGATKRLRILAAAPSQQQEARTLALDLLRKSPSPEAIRIARELVLTTPDRDSSFALVDAVARHYPRDRAVQNKLASMLLARGETKRAEGVLARLQAGAPNDANALASLVATQLDNGNAAAAKASLDAAGPLVDDDARLLSMRAGLHFGAGDLAAARADYQAALDRSPRLTEARIGLAEIALAQGNGAEAERLLDAAPPLPQRAVADLRRRMEMQANLERYLAQPDGARGAELEPLLRAALKDQPDRVDYRLALAQILENDGRSREALAQYGSLQKADPPLREAYLAPVRIHLSLGEHAEAETAFGQFQSRFPGEEDIAQARLFAGQGEQRKRAGDFAGALDSYRKALELAPRNVDIWNGVAGVHFAAGDAAAALDAFENAVAADPTDRAAQRGRVDALASLAGAALERGDRSGAESYLQRALAASGSDPVALERTARLAIAARDWNLARSAAGRLPDSSAARELLALIEVEADLATDLSDPQSLPPEQLLALARRGLAVHPERSELLLYEAQALERLGEQEAASVAFRKAAEKGATSTDAYAGQVRTLVALGRMREARQVFAAVQVRDPQAAAGTELSLLLAEANILKAEGRSGDALAAVERARAVDPENGGVLATLGGLYTETGDLARAIEAYRAALAVRPQDPDLYLGLAGAYFAGRQLHDALAAFDEALRIAPGNSRAIIGRTDVLAGLAADALQRGDHDEAMAHARDSLRGSEGVVPALERTIETALRIGAYDVADQGVRQLPLGARADQLARLVAVERSLASVRADPDAVGADELALIDEALREQPDRADLLLIRAQALERSGDAEGALLAFRRVAQLPAPPAEAYAGQVRVLAALGRTREAVAALAAIRSSDPAAANAAETVLLLAEAEAAKRAGRTREAFAAAERALALEPTNVDVRLTIAGIYAAAGHHDEAIAAYQSVLKDRPGDIVAMQGLAGAAYASGDLARAGMLYDELLGLDPTNRDVRASRVSLWVAEAGGLLAANRVAPAEQLLERALQVDPGNRDALAMQLQIVAGREDWQTARGIIAGVSDPAWQSALQDWLAVEEGVARWRADRTVMPASAVLRLVDQGLRTNPERVDLRLLRAQVLEESGEREAALGAYRELARREDAPVEAITGQVRMLTALERFAEAEALVDRLVTLRPEAANSERAKLYQARAGALKDLGQHAAAFASARDALALAPGDPDTLTLLGWIYLETGQPADAAASFAAALDRRPRDLTALEGLASAQEALGDWQAAERIYLEIASLPEGAYPPAARARIEQRRVMAQVAALRAEGRLSAAVDLLEIVRKRDPRDPDVWAALSEVRNEMGQGSLALTYADQGLQLAPQSERLHMARIRALGRLGRHDEARAALHEAQGQVSSTELARVGNEIERARARAERERFMRDGRLDLAYLALAEEYQLAPNDADVLRAIGYLFLETEQYPESRQFFERAVRVEPQDAAGQLGLAYALRGAGEPGLAIARIESVMQARPSADAALALAELYHEQGRDGQSAEMLAYAKRLGGEPRRVLPPLRIDQARAVAPDLRAERASVLPPLMLPQGVMRAVPDRPPAVPVYEEAPYPSRRSGWRDGKTGAAAEVAMLAFADNAVVNDAAPPEAWAFAGPALDSMRRSISAADDGARGSEPEMLAQALPSFDRVMEDVRGGAPRGNTVPRPAPVHEPVPVRQLSEEAGAPIREEHFPVREERYPSPRGVTGTVEDYIPTAPQPYAVDSTLPPRPQPGAAPSRFEERYRYYEYGAEVVPGTAPEPEPFVLPPTLPPQYTQRLYLEREPAGAGLPIREPVEPPTPLDPLARARLTALERKLLRAQAMKLSVGFRYDFLNSVSDVIADEFALWRFPLFLEVPAIIGSRIRLTAEPTVIDNGIVTDAGVAAEIAVLGMRLGTDVVQGSFGAGVTPVGFADDPDITGFGRLSFQVAQRLSLTPFFERKPVIESLLSYRGNRREGIFFGKVMQNRFGGTLGYRTPQDITGVFEVAYSTLAGVRVEDNEKIDAFFSIGRDFPLGSGYVVRPGAQAYFFHYDKDLSESYPLGLDQELFPVADFPPGGGYFSPDSFLEAALRLDFLGPLMPQTFPGSTFRVGGRVGGQWVSGLDTPRFSDSEGSRATFGGDGSIEVPLADVVVFSAGGGFVVADPYDRVYFEMALLFPL